MAAEAKTYVSREAYLAMERAGEVRHEYVAGEVLAMAGGTVRHDRIFGNVYALLRQRLSGSGGEVFSGNLRVTIPDLDLYTYPDLSVVCGDELYEDDQDDTLLNPLVLIEILSPSTEAYDRGRKFRRYKHLPSFQEYLLIAQDTPMVDHCIRHQDGRWLCLTVEGLDTEITLPSLNCTLSLRDIYARVRFA